MTHGWSAGVLFFLAVGFVASAVIGAVKERAPVGDVIWGLIAVAWIVGAIWFVYSEGWVAGLVFFVVIGIVIGLARTTSELIKGAFDRLTRPPANRDRIDRG